MKRAINPLAGLIFSGAVVALGGCSADVQGGESPAQDVQAVGPNSFAYLRCNATDWDVGEANRFKPTANPNLFALDYEVTQSWLLGTPDSCLVTETNQLNGWGTAQTNYQTNGVLNVPGERQLRVGWQNIQVSYSALGAYRATYNVAQRRLSIASAPAVLWQWPLAGENGRDWIINNYVDGPAPGAQDYTGGTRAYPGHLGIDVDISTFRDQDAGVEVLSVGAGEVLSLEEDQPDRNTTCTGFWNHVTVRAPDGSTLIYGHLKRDSVVVEVGDVVGAGDVLAMVGSSGCSSQPHLHLEAFDSSGTLIDPFARGLWASPPAYVVPLQIMDLIVNAGFYGPEDSLLDPAPNISVLGAPYELTAGLSVGGGNIGDAPGFRLLRPDGSEFDRVDFVFESGPAGHTFWLWGWGLGSEPMLGTWQLQVLINGEVERTHSIQVVD